MKSGTGLSAQAQWIAGLLPEPPPPTLPSWATILQRLRTEDDDLHFAGWAGNGVLTNPHLRETVWQRKTGNALVAVLPSTEPVLCHTPRRSLAASLAAGFWMLESIISYVGGLVSSQKFQTLVRSIFQIGGSLLVAKGILTADQIAQFVGAFGTLYGIGLSLANAHKTDKITTAVTDSIVTGQPVVAASVPSSVIANAAINGNNLKAAMAAAGSGS